MSEEGGVLERGCEGGRKGKRKRERRREKGIIWGGKKEEDMLFLRQCISM